MLPLPKEVFANHASPPPEGKMCLANQTKLSEFKRKPHKKNLDGESSALLYSLNVS